jgi:hypothetical protein
MPCEKLVAYPGDEIHCWEKVQEKPEPTKGKGPKQRETEMTKDSKVPIWDIRGISHKVDEIIMKITKYK